ncbi:hypothetical protein H4219_002208 [Mycoemilia scoparia]|uniref:Uncharacterized protein n=1 Tax=Mycoemilia scoparia TaxID=417184 RepID=A0A9W8DPD8_9FUNG|nr:hypothetical protein H4219_002208 [Mycoemilia scoparia]
MESPLGDSATAAARVLANWQEKAIGDSGASSWTTIPAVRGTSGENPIPTQATPSDTDVGLLVLLDCAANLSHSNNHSEALTTQSMAGNGGVEKSSQYNITTNNSVSVNTSSTATNAGVGILTTAVSPNDTLIADTANAVYKISFGGASPQHTAQGHMVGYNLTASPPQPDFETSTRKKRKRDKQKNDQTSMSNTTTNSQVGKTQPDKPSSGKKASSKSKDGKETKEARRAARRWSEVETEALIQGCLRHGVGAWKKILDDADFKFNNRTSVDLKDRFRTIRAQECAQAGGGRPGSRSNKDKGRVPDVVWPLPPTSQRLQGMQRVQRKPTRNYTREEDVRLLLGVYRHGNHWTRIAEDSALHLRDRPGQSLRDRLRNAFPTIFRLFGYSIPKKERITKINSEDNARHQFSDGSHKSDDPSYGNNISDSAAAAKRGDGKVPSNVKDMVIARLKEMGETLESAWKIAAAAAPSTTVGSLSTPSSHVTLSSAIPFPSSSSGPNAGTPSIAATDLLSLSDVNVSGGGASGLVQIPEGPSSALRDAEELMAPGDGTDTKGMTISTNGAHLALQSDGAQLPEGSHISSIASTPLHPWVNDPFGHFSVTPEDIVNSHVNGGNGLSDTTGTAMTTGNVSSNLLRRRGSNIEWTASNSPLSELLVTINSNGDATAFQDPSQTAFYRRPSMPVLPTQCVAIQTIDPRLPMTTNPVVKNPRKKPRRSHTVSNVSSNATRNTSASRPPRIPTTSVVNSWNPLGSQPQLGSLHSAGYKHEAGQWGALPVNSNGGSGRGRRRSRTVGNRASISTLPRGRGSQVAAPPRRASCVEPESNGLGGTELPMASHTSFPHIFSLLTQGGNDTSLMPGLLGGPSSAGPTSSMNEFSSFLPPRPFSAIEASPPFADNLFNTAIGHDLHSTLPQETTSTASTPSINVPPSAISVPLTATEEAANEAKPLSYDEHEIFNQILTTMSTSGQLSVYDPQPTSIGEAYTFPTESPSSPDTSEANSPPILSKQD